MQSNIADRTLPHSFEAEEHVIACCLIDGGETTARCIQGNLSAASFHIPANQIIFALILDLFQKNQPATLDVLAEELSCRKQLDAVGGLPYLMQVTAKIPTTAHVGYFLEKVRLNHRLRELIGSTSGAVEKLYAFAGEITDLERLAAGLCVELTPDGKQQRSKDLSFDEYLNLDTTKDTDSLLGFRYLGRTNGMVIVGPSGLGKSVISVQFGILGSIGKNIFGLSVSKPLRVLYVQAEDDDGDVAEAVQGVDANYALSPTERKLAAQNFRVVRWNDVTGERFMVRLLGEFTRHPFDLVIINPLFSFAGCDLLNPEHTSHFFRHLLNPFLARTRSAAIVVHHTKKPSTDPKNASNEDTAAYDPFGSSEITNWARAVISLQVVRGSGNKVCKLIFGKRGSRAKLIDREGNPTNSVTVEHSPRGLCWIASDWKPETTAGGQFKPKFDPQQIEANFNPAANWPDEKKRLANKIGCCPKTVQNWKNARETVTSK